MATADIIRQHPIRRFEKGDILLKDGEVSDTLLIIKDGYIKVTSVDEAGDVRLLWIAGRYDIIPTEHLFLLHKPLNFNYTALSDGAVYFMDKQIFLNDAREDLSLMTDVAIGMSGHYDDLLARINSIEQPTVRDKLISTLCYLAGRFGAGDIVDLHKVGLVLTHQDLAGMINSTRETTTLELQKLRKCGCIDYSSVSFSINTVKCKSELVR